MNCRIAALDMDGTLLMSDKSVHPDTIRDIERAGRKGIHVVSGQSRKYYHMFPV